jgi:membrane protease YdiL (CAAX protease family)
VSISAGICEEIVFRGYFQRQFAAYTNSMTGAVVLQGLVFGLGHSYQGMKQVVIISVLGMLYGLLAAWRRSLRPNMIAHAWSDIWGGWLSGVLR